MATRQTRILAHAATAPSTLVLFLWMIVPLAMTIWFSLLRYSLLDPGNEIRESLQQRRHRIPPGKEYTPAVRLPPQPPRHG